MRDLFQLRNIHASFLRESVRRRSRLSIFIRNADRRPGDLLCRRRVGMTECLSARTANRRGVSKLVTAPEGSKPLSRRAALPRARAVLPRAASIIRAGISSQPISSRKSGMQRLSIPVILNVRTSHACDTAITIESGCNLQVLPMQLRAFARSTLPLFASFWLSRLRLHVGSVRSCHSRSSADPPTPSRCPPPAPAPARSRPRAPSPRSRRAHREC